MCRRIACGLPGRAAGSQILAESPSGRSTKPWWRRKRRQRRWARPPAARSRQWLLLTEVRKESSLDDARDTCSRPLYAVSKTPFTSEEVERARNRMSPASSCSSTTRSRWPSRSATGRRWRLAALLPEPRPHQAGHARRRAARCDQLHEAGQSHSGTVHPGRTTRSR